VCAGWPSVHPRAYSHKAPLRDLAGPRSGLPTSDSEEVIQLPSTGQKAQVSGIYANDCHDKQIALSVGEKFPPCWDCKRAANWRLIKATK
jgi:hypothetical protein